MTVVELEKIMIEHGVTLRAIPTEVYGVYEKTHAEEFPDGQILYLDRFKQEMVIVKRIPENAGKFIFKRNCDTASAVRFEGQRYYDSIEEAIEALLQSERPAYHDL